jgi:hypothetical protein|tara:strand:+ start:195 stop:389 length:195 start_codon:yes stop_codon:yes gene_type:complete
MSLRDIGCSSLGITRSGGRTDVFLTVFLSENARRASSVNFLMMMVLPNHQWLVLIKINTTIVYR